MPRIVVTSAANNEGENHVTLDEHVAPAELGNAERSDQLIQRVGWAVHDADEVEGREGPPLQR